MFCTTAPCPSTCTNPCTLHHLTNTLLLQYHSPPTHPETHSPPISPPHPISHPSQITANPPLHTLQHIDKILAIKPTQRTCKHTHTTSKSHTYHCQWQLHDTITYNKWIPEKKLFPYSTTQPPNQLIPLLLQYYTHRQNQHYSKLLTQSFFQTQPKDTRYIHQHPNLTHVHISTTECNPDKDIIAHRPLIQTINSEPHLYDNTGKFIITIPTERLQWLWKQFNIFHNKNTHIIPPPSRL